MKKIKQMVAIILTLIIAAAAIPTSTWVSGIKSEAADFIIWEASTDLLLADEEGKLNDSFAEGKGERKYDTFKKYEGNSAFYSVEFSEIGNGVATNYAFAKSSLNSKTPNFGWLASEKVLNALVPYLYVGFEYRVKGSETLPDDTTLTLNAAQNDNGAIAELAKVNVSDAEEWNDYPITKINASSFAKNWSSGSFTLSLTSATGGLSGTQTVDINNIIIVIRSAEKNAFNQALNKVNGITNIDNFTRGVHISGSSGRKDYFKLFNLYDETTARSGKVYTDAYKIKVEKNDFGDMALSRTMAFGSEDINFSKEVTVLVKVKPNYIVRGINVTYADGTVMAATQLERNAKFSFNMPAQDVTISANIVYEKERELTFLWQNNPGTHNVNPWYSKEGGGWKQVDGFNQTAYEFNITKNEGVVYIYGINNASITLQRYFDTAYFYTNIKLKTESNDRKVKIAVSNNMYYETEIPETDDWTIVKIPLKSIADGPSFGNFRIDLTNRQAGDVITVGETVVFNKELDCTIDEAWAKIYDVSHYEKSDKNTLLGVIGDPDGDVNPWTENGSTVGVVMGWDIAWYYSFQNSAPYIIIPKEDLKGKHYFTTLYGSSLIDASKYVDTGYLEFYIKSETDGIEVPFSVESIGHARSTYATFSVIYDKSKARDDGYMQVRIPFTYFEDAGLNMDRICRVTIKGNQTSAFCDFFLISSMRFYSNLADVPDPDPIVVPEPEPERDMPVEFDTNVLNGKFDVANKTLFVPGNTQIWEVLSALTFDTDETTVDFYQKADKTFIDDELTVLTEQMTFYIYRRGYFLDKFKIKILTEETTTTVTETVEVDDGEWEEYIEYETFGDAEHSKEEYSDEDYSDNDTPKTGDSSEPFAALIVLIVSAAGILFFVINRKKIFN